MKQYHINILNRLMSENTPYIGKLDALYTQIAIQNPRSAWDKGVREYAIEMVEALAEHLDYTYREEGEIRMPESWEELKKVLLNGAASWKEYSWGGCSLCYNFDIAKRLCTPSELKKTENGAKKPNAREEWLDTQTRALCQAWDIVSYHYRNVMNDYCFEYSTCGYIWGERRIYGDTKNAEYWAKVMEQINEERK